MFFPRHVYQLTFFSLFVVVAVVVVVVVVVDVALLSQWDFFPVRNSSRFFQGKPAATESR